ncbi:MAG: NAD(P)/FAD-dependent oxidoreductase, partial [Phycisphaerales bacterium]|nr:NAD(P)/FAD-dependent oxidoreductase [Phycisphaerales bacterium]
MTRHVVSRRAALRAGFGAVGIGVLRSSGLLGSGVAAALATAPALGRRRSALDDGLLGAPILDISADEPSLVVDGMRVARWWSGDDFQFNTIPFHSCENCFPEGTPPAPTEEVEVAVVGGGLSGLCSAYLLRDRQVALFELRDRVGGNTMGERWNGVPYSLGGAYFITPDAGTFLDTLYQELGFEPDVTVDKGSFEIELHGRIVDDFLAARGLPPDQQALFARYAEVVQYY